MGQPGAKKKEITIGDAFGDVTVKANGVSVEIHTDGSVLAYTTADVKKISTIANDAGNGHRPADPLVGEKMLDGTIYAGVSPDTGRAMYAMPADASLTMTFNEAADYAEKLNSERYLGHNDWRVPKKCELDVLFNNRAAIGGLNMSGFHLSGQYWSSSSINKYDAWGHDHGLDAWAQRFSDGSQYDRFRGFPGSVRLVRSDP
jgi:hypothetical protein